MAETVQEWQFDGLVGPTHNYAGLAVGNLAAATNAGRISNPRLAALQGLEKMRFVRDLGMPQAFFPPHPRPIVTELQRNGFVGDISQQLERAATEAPAILAAVFSSAFMWAANAATVTPSRDSADGKLHLTPANLVNHYHRSLESAFTHRLLKKIFRNQDLFTVNNFLYSCIDLADEGAANHMNIKLNDSEKSLHIFVYGKSHLETLKFPARQRRAASESVARLHGLNPSHCFFLEQSPEAIDQGVFHNDVIAMSTGSLIIFHEGAFTSNSKQMLQRDIVGKNLINTHVVTNNQLSIVDAVATYFFNSQLLEPMPNNFILVAPVECRDHPKVNALTNQLLSMGIFNQMHHLDVRESMRNGGGPACLRLRVPMTTHEKNEMHSGVILTDQKFDALTQWVKTHYRDRLCFDDFRDPLFIRELENTYKALEPIIEMPGLYDLS